MKKQIKTKPKTKKKSAAPSEKHTPKEFEGRRAFESNHVIPDKYLEQPNPREQRNLSH